MLSKYFIVFLLSLYSAKCSDIIINIIDDTELAPSRSVEICTLSTCDLVCNNLGFLGGVCVGDKCTCGHFNANKDPVMNLFESVEKCHFASCDQLCRKLGFPGGACFGDRCKCDNHKQMTHVKDIFTRPGTCDYTLCSLSCIRLKHHGGKCMNSHCICYKKIKNNGEGVEPPLENDVDENEEEEHDVVLRGEDPGVVIPKSCDTTRCNDICGKMKYTGGICKDGNCQCY